MPVSSANNNISFSQTYIWTFLQITRYRMYIRLCTFMVLSEEPLTSRLLCKCRHLTVPECPANVRAAHTVLVLLFHTYIQFYTLKALSPSICHLDSFVPWATNYSSVIKLNTWYSWAKNEVTSASKIHYHNHVMSSGMQNLKAQVTLCVSFKGTHSTVTLEPVSPQSKFFGK